MTVQRGKAIAVVDHDIIAVASGVVLGDRHRPRQRGADGCAGGNGQIHAAVPLALSRDRIDAVSEFRGDTALPAGANGGAETVRANKRHIRAGYPALRTSGNAIARQIVHTVGVGLLLLGDL